MGLSNAERQRRWREGRNALARSHPDVVERELLQAAERCERLSGEERTALADKLAYAASGICGVRTSCRGWRGRYEQASTR
jgi:hypothetical protein